jgi:hypothetical protein
VQDFIKNETRTTTIYNRALKKRHQISLSVPTDKKDRLKAARRATFASFIHQKEGAIACYVLASSLRRNYKIYSVHDCFIAPAVDAGYLPSIYCYAFLNMIHPIHLIKKLLEENLFAFSNIKAVGSISV